MLPNLTELEAVMEANLRVDILSAELINHGSDLEKEQRRLSLTELQTDVNSLLEQYPGSSVEWLQSSGACPYGSFTQLTAIVTIRYESRL